MRPRALTAVSIVLAVAGLGGCAMRGAETRPAVAGDLRLSIELESYDVAVGDRIPINVVLTNEGYHAREVCIEPRVFDYSCPGVPGTGYGLLKDDPGCAFMRRVIRPQGSVSWTHSVGISEAWSPCTHLTLTVPIVDPAACDPLPCRWTELTASPIPLRVRRTDRDRLRELLTARAGDPGSTVP